MNQFLAFLHTKPSLRRLRQVVQRTYCPDVRCTSCRSRLCEGFVCKKLDILKHAEEIEWLTGSGSEPLQPVDPVMSSTHETVPIVHSISQHTAVDPKYVQLLGDKAAIEEKISRFINFKQAQNDSSNVREFCGGMNRSWCEAAEDGCARTQAIYHPRRGVSRVNVKRVVNPSGPQTADGLRDAVCQRMPQTVTASSLSHTTEYPLPTAINERLTSMEVHVKLSAGKPVPGDVYQRIQNLENRILQLESISPEYFDIMTTYSSDRRKLSRTENTDTKAFAPYKNLTAAEVDRRIITLKQTLARKLQ